MSRVIFRPPTQKELAREEMNAELKRYRAELKAELEALKKRQKAELAAMRGRMKDKLLDKKYALERQLGLRREGEYQLFDAFLDSPRKRKPPRS